MWSEFRFASRALARWRGGALTAVLTLAVGIGTTTGLFALVRVMLAELPGVPDLGSIARVYAASPKLGVDRAPVALNEFDTILSHATSFGSLGAYAEAAVTLGPPDAASPATAGYASPGFFSVMGVAPAAGRAFTSADIESHRPVVIVSEAIWKRHVPGGELADATLTVDGVARTVVGVMPHDFSYGFVGITADVWIPLTAASADTPAIVTVFARLRPGVGWPAAAAELGGLAHGRGPWTWRAVPIQEDTRRRAVSAMALTFGPGLVVLLIGCVNVACLLMARGMIREKELSVRRALGATRARVVRHLLIESLLLALAGGTLGCGLAIVVLRVIADALAAVQPDLAARVTADAGLLPVALGLSAVACLLFGTVPALRLSRRDVAASLNGVPPAHRIDIAGYGPRDLVVFVEVGSAVGLIVFAAMLFNLSGELRRIAPAFPADRIVAVRVAARDVDEVAGRIAAVPGVARVAMSSGMLGSAGTVAQVLTTHGLSVSASIIPVGDAFFDTLGVPLVRGRSFDAADVRRRSAVAVISESAARRLSAYGDPLGMELRITRRHSATVVVIGICGDAIDYGTLARAGLMPPDVYVPYDPAGLVDAVVLARAATDARGLLRPIAAAATTAGRRRPPQPSILSEQMPRRDRDAGSVAAGMLEGFALVALLLAGTGVFAVLSQSVAQRTREFGIRLSLGAAPRRVLAMVLARELKLIVAAVGSGAAFTIGLTHALFVELTSLSAAAPLVWVSVAALCGGVAALACGLATYRIVRLEPATVLRRT